MDRLRTHRDIGIPLPDEARQAMLAYWQNIFGPVSQDVQEDSLEVCPDCMRKTAHRDTNGRLSCPCGQGK